MLQARAGRTALFLFAALALFGVFGGQALASGPPAVTVEATSDLRLASITLNGTVNPNEAATTYKFEYGPTTSYGSSTPVGSLVSGSVPVKVSAQLAGLEPQSTYHYRLSATNSSGTTNSTDHSFVTSYSWHVDGLKLSSLAEPANYSGSGSSITLKWFGSSGQEYLVTCSNASSVGKLGVETELVLPAGCKNFQKGIEIKGCALPKAETIKTNGVFTMTKPFVVEFSEETCALPNFELKPTALLSDIQPLGEERGSQQVSLSGSTTTPAGKAATISYSGTWRMASPYKDHPFGVTKENTAEFSPYSLNEVTFTGEVNPEGVSTTYWFEYGKTEALGSSTSVLSAGSGSTGVPVSVPVRGLDPNTTYYYRLKSTNSNGTKTGSIKSTRTARWVAGTEPLATFPATFAAEGVFGIELPGFALSITCNESKGSGNIGNAGGTGDSYSLSLQNCTTVQSGKESKSCRPLEPINVSLNDQFKSTSSKLMLVQFNHEFCALSDMELAEQEPFKVSWTHAAPGLKETIGLSSQTKFGAQTVKLSAATSWSLTGGNLGRTFWLE
jgi:hypothetical protein